MVIRATESFNLHCNNVARQVEEKCCPYYRTFTEITQNKQDLEKYNDVTCNRWSKQIKGCLGNATISRPLKLHGFAQSCVHKCSFSFRPVLLLVGRFTRVPKWECNPWLDLILSSHKNAGSNNVRKTLFTFVPERSKDIIYVSEHKLRRGNCIASWEFYRRLLIIHRLVWLSDGCNCVRELVKRIQVVVTFEF